MSTDCGTMEPKKESSYQIKVSTISKEVSELHETITKLTSTISTALKPEQPDKVCEGNEKAPCAPIENFLDETINSIQAANARLNSLIERCVL